MCGPSAFTVQRLLKVFQHVTLVIVYGLFNQEVAQSPY